VPRLLVAAALVGETAYSDLPQTMVELMRLVQQGDAFAREHIHDFKQSRGNQAGDSPWSIIGDGLLVASTFLRIMRSERSFAN
jgi:hypothetical protein